MVIDTRSSASSVTVVPGGAIGPEHVSWRIHREIVLLAGWGAAILLQFAHPLVAQAVADHSGFRADGRAPWRRLRGTLNAMLAMTFGTAEELSLATGRINAIHDRVHGALPSAHAAHPAGARYSAHDPALLRWVHATCLDVFMATYELYVGPLAAEEKDRYCAESSRVAPLLGIPDGYLPATSDELRAYMDAMWNSGQVGITDTAQRLARDLFAPRLPAPVRPLMWAVRILAVGLLSPGARQAYGFRWTKRHRTTFRVLVWLARRTLRLLPPALRYWRIARVASQRVPAETALL